MNVPASQAIAHIVNTIVATQIAVASTARRRRFIDEDLSFYTHAKPFTNSTRLRNAMPDGPFAIQGF